MLIGFEARTVPEWDAFQPCVARRSRIASALREESRANGSFGGGRQMVV